MRERDREGDDDREREDETALGATYLFEQMSAAHIDTLRRELQADWRRLLRLDGTVPCTFGVLGV